MRRVFVAVMVSAVMVSAVMVSAVPIPLASTAGTQVSSSSKHKSPISRPPADSGSSQPQQNFTEQPQPSPPLKPRVHIGPDIKATDAERAAITFTGYDLDIRLVPAQQSIAVRAVLKVRNDGEQPLVHLPLQISSSLEWETVRIVGQEAPEKEAVFGLQTIDSDADHTGQLREAIIVLPQPLAPGKQLSLDVIYGGTVELSGKRLEAIGTPLDIARRSDWDRISPEFTGLRGFGNVAWYPVSSVPVALGDGARLFTETGRQKLSQSSAVVQMKVSIEYVGAPPNLALLDGHQVAITAGATPLADAPSEDLTDVPLIATCSLPASMLNFAAPSLILAKRIEESDLRSGTGSAGPSLNAYLRAGDELNIEPWLGAMAKVAPLLEQWLGTSQRTPLTIVDLPEADDASFETGSALLTPLAKNMAADQLAVVVLHALAHSYFHSSREWLNEGVPYFIGTLWMESSTSRETTLQSLDGAPLALAEPASPVEGDGQDLLHARDPVYYRSKAAIVLWMLRDLVGDEQLSAALRDYDPVADTSPDYFELLLQRGPRGGVPKPDRAGKLDGSAEPDGSEKNSLKWFFDDWVYRDRGLPDLSIEAVFSSKSAAAGSYVVAVNLANEGYAAAEVPLTIRSGVTSITERILIPARSKITHRMLVQGLPVEASLNDGTVPEVQSSHHVKTVDKPEQR